MRWLKRICILLLLAAVFFWGVFFASENTAQVGLHLVFLKLPPASISLWVILGFSIGGLVGLILSFLLVIKLRGSLMRAERRAKLFEKEIATLRANSLKDNES